MKVVVTADDFGVTHGVNEAVSEAHEFGTLSSTSIRTNGVAYKEGVTLLKSRLKGIGVGLHLNLTDGPSHTPSLSNEQGVYSRSFISYYREIKSGQPHLKQSIKNELRAQFEIIKRDSIRVDHIDGQDHIHMIPEIFEIVCQLASDYGVKAVRLSNEPFFLISNIQQLRRSAMQLGFVKNFILSSFAATNLRLLKKYNLVSTNRYFGVLYTSNMNLDVFTRAIDYGLYNKVESIEIALHPGYSHFPSDVKFTSDFFRKYETSKARDSERKSLLSQQMKNLLSKKQIEICRFSDLA